MEHTTKEKRQRNILLKQFCKDHPELNHREVGDIFGISRCRVWQILNPDYWRGKN